MMFINTYGKHPEACITQAKLAAEAKKYSKDLLADVGWSHVKELLIFGTAANDKRPPAPKRLDAGVYVYNDGGAVLIVDAESIQKYISYCTDRLESLTIRFVERDILDLSEVPTGLVELNLSKVPLTNLNSIVLPDTLEELYLNDTNISTLNGVKLPSNLRHLELCDTPLRSLDGIRFPKKLQYLHLQRSHLTDLSAIIFPTNLQVLSLSGAAIKKLPESLKNLKKLTHLGLASMELEELPVWLSELGLQFSRNTHGNAICLHETTVKDVDMTIFDQPQETILQWFEEQKRKKQSVNKEIAHPLRELKIVFLGDGEAGKSHTIARLLHDGEQADDFPGVSTPGIVIDDKTYTINGREIKVHFWDFGGQEILHSMHRMFLTERTLYVVVLNVREGNQQERARYWLHNLRSFANGAPVLLVLNKMDMNKNASVNESDLRAMYPGLTEIVKMSAREDSREQFENSFLAALHRQIGAFEHLESPFLPAWSRLKDELQNMTSSYIRGDVFRGFCDKCGVTGTDDVRRGLLNWFSDLGVSFCYSGSRALEDYVVLRPDWITNAIYILLFNRMTEVKNGLVSHETIYEMLQSPDNERTVPGATYEKHEVEYVLNVIRKFRLSFEVDAQTEFLPMLCDANSTAAAETYANDPGALEFRMHYEYLPNNVLHRLMVERRRDLDLNNVWLTGARFVCGDTGLSAVVKSEGNLLRILVRSEGGDMPQRYLEMLKDDIERINEHMGLSVSGTEVAYKQDGLVECFDYEDLLLAQELGDSHIRSRLQKRKIPLNHILMQSDYPMDENRRRLLEDMTRISRMLQDNKMYWESSENERTTYIRDLLQAKDYIVMDQHLTGASGTGISAGELDLEIRLKPDAHWAAFEALNIRGKGKSALDDWDEHLARLLGSYNAVGRSFLIHMGYVECAKDKYSETCNVFREHLRWYSPQGFELLRWSVREITLDVLEERQGRFVQMVQCVYDCGGAPMTVYHFFVRIGS